MSAETECQLSTHLLIEQMSDLTDPDLTAKAKLSL